MPRTAAQPQIDRIIQEAAEAVVARVSAAIARSVADRVQAEMQRELTGGAARRGRRAAPRRVARRDITRWVADNRARRVPNFVIDATGLDTKKKIVAKFGEGAAFEKGKPLPKARA
ncbi:MAG TPA: hypothetical protein VLU43_05265 [Anaeromyxobacteraceae bacterium]|nr:hypothetical protein [Anaeromyxobacteraceae bacterium]